MPTDENTSNAITLAGVYVPRNVIDELDRCLPALYGLIEAIVALVEDQIPEGSEKRLVCSGMVTWFFQTYSILNTAGLLFFTSSKVETARRASEYMREIFGDGGHHAGG